MKVKGVAARCFYGVAGEKQTSVDFDCRSRSWKARDVLESHCRDHATELASATLGTAAPASDDVTPYVRVQVGCLSGMCIARWHCYSAALGSL